MTSTKALAETRGLFAFLEVDDLRRRADLIVSLR
jgi:hypothetical protein